jgi:hypothetical protein
MSYSIPTISHQSHSPKREFEMSPQHQDTYISPVKNAQPIDNNTAKTSKTTATTALSENSGYKDPVDADYMYLKKLSSDTKSLCVSKLV